MLMFVPIISDFFSSSSQSQSFQLSSVTFEDPEPNSRDLGDCISLMPYLTKLELVNVVLHDKFFSEMKSVAESMQVNKRNKNNLHFVRMRMVN